MRSVCGLALLGLGLGACAEVETSGPLPAEIPDAVQRAFETSCTLDGCHDATARAGGLSLDAADSVTIIDGPSMQANRSIVHVGDLAGSYMAIKLLPDAQLPAGAVRLGDRMPQSGVRPQDVDPINTILAWIAGYGPSEGDDAAAEGPGTTTGAATGAGSTGGDPTTGGADTGPVDPSGGTMGPRCSVEEVSEGAVIDPLDAGDVAGKFPVVIAEVLEDRCGCHTLADRTQNTAFPFLLAPAGSLFLELSDMDRALSGSTLGAVMHEQIYGTSAMPPGSCPAIPVDDRAVLQKWFDDGWPDGATFQPP